MSRYLAVSPWLPHPLVALKVLDCDNCLHFSIAIHHPLPITTAITH